MLDPAGLARLRLARPIYKFTSYLGLLDWREGLGQIRLTASSDLGLMASLDLGPGPRSDMA